MTEIEHRRNECRDAEYGLELEAAREELSMNRARIANMEAINADQNAICLELDRLSLVIESAVRNADPGNHELVLTLIKSNMAAIAKAKP